MQDYLHRQTADKPLFPDLIWSRPENKNLAGKLLIVGGNAHGFAAPAEAYNEADRAGVGISRVLLPDSLRKSVGKIFLAGEYAPSTPSGSFGQRTLAELLDMSLWADGLVLAGDFGRNSETAILLEQVAQKYNGLLTITQDGLDYFTKSPTTLLNKDNVLLVASFAQLQKMAIGSHFETAFTFDMNFLSLVEALHDFTLKHKTFVITKHLDNIFVAVNGQVSATKLETDLEVWRVKVAARAATWWLQNPAKAFESLTSSVILN